jgi:arginyl-tRNA synthetase
MRSLIVNDLEKSIDRVLKQKNSTAVLKNRKIQLYLFQENTSIIYRCAIAHKLTTSLRLSALEIADRLVEKINNHESNLIIKISPPGWIDFHLSDRYIANWLEHLSISSFRFSDRSSYLKIDSDRLFVVQYAHARCCSLLLLGEQINSIELKDKQFQQAVWQLLTPVSWLDERGNLRSSHPAETGLIQKLLAMMDELCDRESDKVFKSTVSLSEALLLFWDDCRIYDFTSKHTPQLAKARLGLVAATQLLLKISLEELMGISALVEL